MHPVSDGGYLFRNDWGMLIEGLRRLHESFYFFF